MDDTLKKDLVDMTPEEKEKAWQDWVRSEVRSILDIYLPVSKGGNVNLSYSSVILEHLEGGPVFSENLKDAVMVSLIFDFKDPIDITKPRVVEEETL